MVIYGCANKDVDDQHPYYLCEEFDVPVEFAAGKILTTNGINFTYDGMSLYISRPLEQTFTNGRQFAGIFRSDFEDGTWTSPELVDFGINIDAYHPVLSYDNQIMLFNSRSHPDTLDLSIPHNIWFSTKAESGWAIPEMLDEINGPYYDSYPTIARNNSIYFNSDRPGGQGGMDIYVSKLINGKYQEPVNIETLNSADTENDLVIDPDERFIILNRYIHPTKELDLYIAFNEKNTWTEPVKLDLVNQPDAWELTPSLSPDGNYFFYELNGKIMQLDLGKLLRLK